MATRFPKGFIPVAIVIIISVVAVAMVGAGVYYKVKKDAEPIVNTNTTVNRNTNAVADCQRFFDGCNTCSRDEDGSVTCTERFCKKYEPYRCLDNEAAVNTNTAVDDTAGWEVYTNDSYNYSFKYPENWVAKKENKQIVRVYPESLESSDGMPDLVTVSISSTGLEDGPVEPQTISINGREAISGVEYGMVNFRTTVFSVNNEYIKIWWQDGLADQTKQEQILSTFQFTE